MRPASVIFDCDGVLVDSEPPTFELLAEDLAGRGLDLSHAEIERLFLGGTMPGVYAKAKELGADMPDDWVQVFYERLYERLAQGTLLIPGIIGVMDALDRASIPYAVGSNGSQRKMRVTLGQHPGVMERLAGRIFSGQEIGRPKPAPDLYLHAARALGVPPESCVVIEDSPTGARAAAAAGMRCFGYAPHDDGAKLRIEGAIPFRSMADLPALLEL
ncbi:MAG: hydrolase [Cereibacter sphaeroides]|uniref:Hydrolase n=1 Tax=Cereibacter sphaeroides TaxID=1063 RepID=A0A2W5SAE2_CERSP|nr:MAG: hydrolase [Cereibacter sphaeroides]